MNRKQRRGEKKQGRPVPPGASPRVQDVLADALRHHQAGRLNEAGRHVYASLGLARPADPDMYGYISELHGYGMTAEASGEQAEDLAATMLASTLGLDFDPEAAWNERKQRYEHSSLIIDSTSITAAAECGPENHWTCAIAAAVFLFS